MRTLTEKPSAQKLIGLILGKANAKEDVMEEISEDYFTDYVIRPMEIEAMVRYLFSAVDGSLLQNGRAFLSEPNADSEVATTSLRTYRFFYHSQALDTDAWMAIPRYYDPEDMGVITDHDKYEHIYDYLADAAASLMVCRLWESNTSAVGFVGIYQICGPLNLLYMGQTYVRTGDSYIITSTFSIWEWTDQENDEWRMIGEPFNVTFTVNIIIADMIIW